MADAAELKRIQETLDYFNRYYEFDSAIKVLKENRQYLETYIRTKHYVEDKYDAYGKTRKSMIVALIVAAVAALIVLLASGITSLETVNIIVAVVVAAVCGCGVFFLFKTLIAKNVEKKWQEQQKVNDDIAVQIDEVTKRCENLEAQRNGYLDALDEKNLIVIPSKYIIEAEKIAAYVKEDKVKTAEEAVKMFEDEQNRLKERALAERKRREEEAAAAKALNIERERQRAIREQREAELRKVAEEERQRANVTPPSEIAPSREQPAEVAESASAPQSKGLSLALGSSSKKNARKPEPAVKAAKDETPATEERREPRSGGLSLASGAKPSGASVKAQEARPHRTVESVMMGGEMADIAAQPSGNGLALAGNKKKRPQRTAPMQQEKQYPKHEPIRLVDEPDDTPQEVDEETLDIEARMQSLLSANKPVLKRHSPMSQEQRDSIEKRISSQLEPEQTIPTEEETPMPIEQPITEAQEPEAQEAAEQIPAEPETPIEPTAPTEPEAPEEPAEPEAPPEQPKNPFSGLAMKKK